MLNAQQIQDAYNTISGVIKKTPLEKHEFLSQKLSANIYLKREDLQVVRSYKLRGAYNLISSLSQNQKDQGIVCASAGNHAQGVAHSCSLLKVKGIIYMPRITPKQKIRMTEKRGGEWVEVRLEGDTFDESAKLAREFQKTNEATFIHPFDHESIMAGGGTVALEMLTQIEQPIDFLVAPIGGGGLCSGMAVWLQAHSPHTKLLGVEPEGAESMTASMTEGKVVTLNSVEKFVDGAAVAQVGHHTFSVLKNANMECVQVSTGAICAEIINLYTDDAIVVEPAGAMSIAALEKIKTQIQGKTVVCIVSGGNNDLDRIPEIKERALIHQGLKHYFLVSFPQRAGALREFLDQVLGPNDDITRFEYTKSNHKEGGPALVGIELKYAKDYQPLVDRMQTRKLPFRVLADDKQLFEFLV